MGLDRLQHVAETARQVGADRLLHVGRGDEGQALALGRDGEMVGPEAQQAFAEGVLGKGRADEGDAHLAQHLAAGFGVRLPEHLFRPGFALAPGLAQAAERDLLLDPLAERGDRPALRGQVGACQPRQHHARRGRRRDAGRQPGSETDGGDGVVIGLHGGRARSCVMALGP